MTFTTAMVYKDNQPDSPSCCCHVSGMLLSVFALFGKMALRVLTTLNIMGNTRNLKIAPKMGSDNRHDDGETRAQPFARQL
jgi:hypothetical protein